jgi:hypothetical protein
MACENHILAICTNQALGMREDLLCYCQVHVGAYWRGS